MGASEWSLALASFALGVSITNLVWLNTSKRRPPQ